MKRALILLTVLGLLATPVMAKPQLETGKQGVQTHAKAKHHAVKKQKKHLKKKLAKHKVHKARKHKIAA